MNDDIVFQPGSKDGNDSAPLNTSEKVSEAMSEPDSGEGKVFDFSSDLNISVVKDDAAKVYVPTSALPQNPFKPNLLDQQKQTVNPAPIQVVPPVPTAPAEPAKPEQATDTDSLNLLTKKLDYPAKVAAAEEAPSERPVFKQPSPIFMPSPATEASLASLAGKKPELSVGDSTTVLKNLRTYEGDIAEVLAQRGTSAVSVAIADSKRKGEGERIANKPAPVEPVRVEEVAPSAVSYTATSASSSSASTEEESSHSGSKLIIVLICVILVGAGAALGYYLYSKSPLAAITPVSITTNKTLPSLVPSDSQAIVSMDNSSAANFLADVQAELGKQQPAGSIREMVVTEIKDAKTYRASATEMLSLFSIPMPDIIARTLTPEWMLGTYADMDGNKTAFVVLTTNLFQNAFAGMLGWEGSMYRDLAILQAYPANTSGTFKDEIIKNKDVRAFVSAEGNTLFEYSFVDNKTLVVTANDTVMNAVITRLESKAFMR